MHNVHLDNINDRKSELKDAEHNLTTEDNDN